MFHDASVSRIEQIGNELHLETEEYSVDPGERMLPARIVIGPIAVVFRNGERIERFAIESGDAEIHALDKSPDGVELVLMWQWYAPTAEAYVAYRFPGATVRVEDHAGGLPVVASDNHTE